MSGELTLLPGTATGTFFRVEELRGQQWALVPSDMVGLTHEHVTMRSGDRMIVLCWVIHFTEMGGAHASGGIRYQPIKRHDLEEATF